MVKLSVVIIAFNEEKNIDRCLSSVASVADDIVVIDSGSTDKTVEICTRHNARVVEQPFLGHIEQPGGGFAEDHPGLRFPEGGAGDHVCGLGIADGKGIVGPQHDFVRSRQLAEKLEGLGIEQHGVEIKRLEPFPWIGEFVRMDVMVPRQPS